MHESIATALYKGEVRQYESRVENLAERFGRRSWVGRRGPWFREAQAWWDHNPAFAEFGRRLLDHKKHGLLMIYGLAAPRSVQGGTAWEGITVRLHKKSCDMSIRQLPVQVTHHCVKRIMQRANEADPRTALRRQLSVAFPYACFVEPVPSAESVLLPAIGGAVIAVADRDYPDCWVFLTFVDAEKLRPEQKREVLDRLARLKEHCESVGITWEGGFPEAQFA